MWQDEKYYEFDVFVFEWKRQATKSILKNMQLKKMAIPLDRISCTGPVLSL